MTTRNLQNSVLFLAMPNIALWRHYPYIEPPFGSSLVAGSLKQEGFNVTYLDLNLQVNAWSADRPPLSPGTLASLENWTNESSALPEKHADLTALIDRLIDLFPGTFPFAALSLNRITINTRIIDATIGFAIAFARRLKERIGCSVIAGGQAPEWVNIERVSAAMTSSPHPVFDYLFLGDGALSLPRLLWDVGTGSDNPSTNRARRLDATGRFIHFGKKGEMSAPDGRLVERVGEAFPPLSASDDTDIDRRLLDITPSYAISNRSLYFTSFDSVFPVETNREWTHRPICILPYKFMYGCTHRCAFCKTANVRPAFRPIARAVDDIERYVKEHGVTDFRFFNSQINCSESVVNEFCAEVMRRKLCIQFSDSASLRRLSRDTCLRLREAGCIKLWFGVESPNDRILAMIDKELDVNGMREGLMNAHEAGIWIGANMIVGFPHETDDEFAALLDFIRDHRDVVNCWQVSPLELHHNTPLFEHPERYGIRVHGPYDQAVGMRGYAFSETGGLGWEARLKRSRDRTDRSYEELGSTQNRFASNDYLVFSLYRALGTKTLVTAELKRYLRKIKHRIRLHDAARWINTNDACDFAATAFSAYWSKTP